MEKYENEIKDVLGDDDCLIVSKGDEIDAEFIAISTKNRLLGYFSVINHSGIHGRLGNYKIIKLTASRDSDTNFVIRNSSIKIGSETFGFEGAAFTPNEIKMVLVKLDELDSHKNEPKNLSRVD